MFDALTCTAPFLFYYVYIYIVNLRIFFINIHFFFNIITIFYYCIYYYFIYYYAPSIFLTLTCLTRVQSDRVLSLAHPSAEEIFIILDPKRQYDDTPYTTNLTTVSSITDNVAKDPAKVRSVRIARTWVA